MRDGKTGLLVAAATFLATFLLGGNSSGPALPAVRRGWDEPEEEGFPNLSNVSYIAESSRVGRSGRRGTIVVLTNGAKIESGHPVEAYGTAWPTFVLSVANGGPRRTVVNPAEVIGVEKSMFRRTTKDRPDTVILTTGDSVVVRESLDEVRRRIWG